MTAKKIWMPAACLIILTAGCLAQDSGLDERRFVAGIDINSDIVETLTPAEKSVLETIREPGVHVVHLWSPTCHNSINELREGWYKVIEENKDVSFTFVTVFNNGESAQETLQRYGVADMVTELTLEDFGPSRTRANRRKEFLGLPLQWTPTTWVFNRRGKLAFAVNYGEASMESLNLLLTAASTDWSH